MEQVMVPLTREPDGSYSVDLPEGAVVTPETEQAILAAIAEYEHQNQPVFGDLEAMKQQQEEYYRKMKEQRNREIIEALIGPTPQPEGLREYPYRYKDTPAMLPSSTPQRKIW